MKLKIITLLFLLLISGMAETNERKGSQNETDQSIGIFLIWKIKQNDKEYFEQRILTKRISSGRFEYHVYRSSNPDGPWEYAGSYQQKETEVFREQALFVGEETLTVGSVAMRSHRFHETKNTGYRLEKIDIWLQPSDNLILKKETEHIYDGNDCRLLKAKTTLEPTGIQQQKINERDITVLVQIEQTTSDQGITDSKEQRQSEEIPFYITYRNTKGKSFSHEELLLQHGRDRSKAERSLAEHPEMYSWEERRKPMVLQQQELILDYLEGRTVAVNNGFQIGSIQPENKTIAYKAFDKLFTEENPATWRLTAQNVALNHATEFAESVIGSFLRDPDGATQYISAMERMPDPRFLPTILEAARSNLIAVREAAASALRTYNSPESVEMLLTLLADSEPTVRQKAVESLGQMKDSDLAIDGIMNALDDPEPSVSGEAMVIAGKLKLVAAAPKVRSKLKETEREVLFGATFYFRALPELIGKHDVAEDLLLLASPNSDSFVESFAIDALVESRNPIIVPYLNKLISELETFEWLPEQEHRGETYVEAVMGAAQMGHPSSERALQELIERNHLFAPIGIQFPSKTIQLMILRAVQEDLWGLSNDEERLLFRELVEGPHVTLIKDQLLMYLKSCPPDHERQLIREAFGWDNEKPK